MIQRVLSFKRQLGGRAPAGNGAKQEMLDLNRSLPEIEVESRKIEMRSGYRKATESKNNILN